MILSQTARKQLAAQAQKILSEKSFHDLVKAAWHLVEPEIVFRDNWHIEVVCQHLEAAANGKIRNLIVNVPPGSMKSLLTCVFWPAWVWTTRPTKRFMFASYSDALTMRDSVRCRTVLASEWYQHQWPLALKADQNTKGLFENSKGGWRLATSTGGQGTGNHPDFFVADDPNNAKDTESDTTRQSVNDWWDGTISTRGISRGVGQIVIQQRLHVNDLTGHLLEKGQWEHICLPMRFESDRKIPQTSIGFTDPRTIDGQLLWPSLFSDEIVTKMEKTMGLYHSAGQLQQRPAPRGGGMFKREWFEIIPALPKCVNMVRYVDKAGTEGGDGAFTACVLVGITADEQFIIVDVVRDRLAASERERLIKQIAILDQQRYGYVTTWIEQEPGSGGKESAEATVRNLAGFTCKIERVTGSKEVRAEPFQAQASVRNVKILAGPWNAPVLDELCVFPAGKFKDQVDACAGAINKLAVPTGAFSSGDQIVSLERYFDESVRVTDEFWQDVDFN